MPLDADVAAALTAFNANADYDSATDASKAMAFAAACRKLIGLRAQLGRKADEQISFDTASLYKMLEDAQEFASQLASSSPSGGYQYANFSSYRE
jgi:hypothetical protein